jgi:LacI family transcriptional regulator
LNLSNRRKSFSPTIEGGIEGARLLLESEEMPSGIFAHNDLLAIGAIEELERQGLSCPRDVSVIGYNDAPLTDRLSPPLSTIRLAGGKVGTLAACRLIDLISGQQVEPVTERLPPELVPRGSSGPFVVR